MAGRSLRSLLVCIAFVLAVPAFAQLAHNGTSTLATNWVPGTLSRTVAHTTPNLQNRVMAVAVHMNVVNATGATVQGVTYAGNPLIFGDAITDASTDVRTEIWYLVAPATGANNVIVTLQGIGAGESVQGVIGVMTFVDADQTLAASIGYTATNNNATPTNGGLAGTAAGDLVVDFTTARQNAGGTITAAVGGGQTSVYNTNSPAAVDANDTRAVASTEVSTGAAVTMSYTLSAGRPWAMAGGSLRGAVTDVSITGIASPDVIDVSAQNVTFTFTIRAKNHGANAVNFSDTLPAGLTIVSATPSQGTCTPGATTTCNIGSIAAGGSATVTLVASTAGGTAGTIYNNAASITSGTTDAIAGNNSTTVTVRTQGQLCATPGKDGAGGTLTGSVNTYFPATASAAAGAATITLGAVPAGYGATGITAGDLLLVIQMQDAAIDSNNDERYGDGTGVAAAIGSAGSGASNLNNAGRYEYVVATNAITTAGGALTFSGAGTGGGLLYAYTNANASGTQGQRRFQVIRVPQYTTATITPAVATPAWNGAVGGVFVIDAMSTVTLGSAAGTGTVATTAGSQVVTGTGTSFLTQLHSGDTINVTGETARTVVRVVSNTQLWVSTAMSSTGTGRTFTVPTLSVSSIGFRGGAGRQLAGGAGADTDYRTTAATATNAQKGEGIAGTPRYLFNNSATVLDTGVEGYPNGSSARGAPGNAGGGGTDGNPAVNDENTGGGGGANGGSGGLGGNAWNSADASGGFGGSFGFASTTRMILGGGGGSGTTNNATQSVPAGTPAMGVGIASSGAWGGGLVIIRANTLAGTGTIAANGGWALDVLNDAGGGGGAGGTVLVTTRYGTLTGLTVQARGGRGGNAWLTQTNPGYPGERHGPGGGGGGGAVHLSSAAASVDVSGGANGLTTTDNDNFGAGPGLIGTSSTPLGAMAGAGANYGCAVADLAVTITDSPDPVQPNANVTYTQNLTNNGPNAADLPVFTTAVPASATFVSITPPAGWTCITPAVGNTGLITCSTVTPLASGASVNFPFVVKADPGTPPGYILSNTANATSQTTDSNAANNTDTETTNVTNTGYADLSVVITDTPDPVVANTNISYTQTVRNAGSSAAVNATFTETTPPNTTFQGITPPAGWTCITPAIGGTGTITCTTPSMASGVSVNFPLTLRVNAGTPNGTVITETATVSSTTTDPYTANNTSSTTTTVQAATSADLAVTIVGTPDPVTPGSFVTFTETVTNNGPATAANCSFTQNTPAGTTFQSLAVPAGWACVTPAVGGTGAITCTRASFATGIVSTFAPVFRVNGTTTPGTTITQTVNVTTTTTDPVAANNSASDSVIVASSTSADVQIVKSDNPDPVNEGMFLTYVLRVTNNGPAVATGIVVTDPLPAAIGFGHAEASQGSCSGTTTITCNIGTLGVRHSATIHMVVASSTSGTINNTASVTRNETDPVPSNDSDSESTTVLAPTLVRLLDFTAHQKNKKVQLIWRTDLESDNLGFNLYREIGGVRTKINRDLIAGSAMMSKRRDAREGRVYRFNDKLDDPNAMVQYWLEDVDLDGTKTPHGPASPRFDDVADAPDSPSLAGLGSGGSVVATPAGFGIVRPIASFTFNDKQSKQQFDLAADNALKIFVKAEGWHRVTRAAMVAAGFDPGTDGKRLALFSIGIENAIVVDEGTNNKFDEPTDAVEFYGIPLDTASTGARTYWLAAGKGKGDRVSTSKQRSGDPFSGSVAFAHERKERAVYYPVPSFNPDDQSFYGPVITSSGVTQELALGSIDTSSVGNASLAITIQGGTDVPHIVELSMNGRAIGTAALSRTDQRTFTFAFPHSWLVAGTNALGMRSLAGDDDVTTVLSTRIDFQHALRADDNAFLGTLPGGRASTVAGFVAGRVRAFDVTDPAQPIELETSVDGAGTATFTPPGNGAHSVLVFHESRMLAAPEMVANRPSSLNATKAKDAAALVIISNPAFAAAAAPLKSARDQQGIATAVIDVDDVYDEYNFGIRDPRAIRAFLESYAPRYALLGGDASFDPRGYLDMGSYDFLPTKFVPTLLMQTASDDWMADFNNDGVAEIPIGRIPVRNATDAARVFSRLASRGTPSGTWANSALTIADVDFNGEATTLASLLPPSMSAQQIDLASARSAMNQGQLLVTYIGHGSTELWGHFAFTTEDALNLGNGSRLPFVVSLTCLNGYFHDLWSYSLAEGLMNAPNGGAAGVWASSTLTTPDQQALMARELYRQLFSGTPITIGEAVRRAKLATSDPDVRRSWILFGDPSMGLR